MRGRPISRLLIVAALTVVSYTGCETLKALVSIERPNVHVDRASITMLSFEGAEVTAVLSVENPNPIGISLDGFSYAFDIEGSRFVDGDVPGPIEIDPMSTSPLSVPVSFTFLQVVDTVQSLQGKDEARFDFDFQLRFTLPVLGAIDLPAHISGSFPIVRLPSVALEALRVESISLTSAELVLDVALDNPNGFGLSLQSFEYVLEVAGRQWSEGRAAGPQRVDPHTTSTFRFPFSISFISVGRSVRDVLVGDSPLDYHLIVAADAVADLDLLPRLHLPFDHTGSITLSR